MVKIAGFELLNYLISFLVKMSGCEILEYLHCVFYVCQKEIVHVTILQITKLKFLFFRQNVNKVSDWLFYFESNQSELRACLLRAGYTKIKTNFVLKIT